MVVAVRACGSPPFADVIADLPELVPYTHLWLLLSTREYDIGGQAPIGRRRYAADAASVRLSLPIGRLDGGSRRREAHRQAVGLELEERFGIA